MKIKYISVLVNIILSVFILVLFIQNKNINDSLAGQSLKPQTYIPQKKGSWDSNNKEGYYLFTLEDNSIDIRSFDQKPILKAKYEPIGNGVYQLENSLGYLVKTKKGIDVQLNTSNPLVFKSYILFSKK